jgi:hypothetical protein
MNKILHKKSRFFSIYFIIGIILLLWVYIPWIHAGSLGGGDWHYQYQKFSSSSIFSFWNEENGNGLGGTTLPIFGLNIYYRTLGTFFTQVGFSWDIAERLIFSIPFLIFGIYSSYKFSILFSNNFLYRYLSVLIFMTNTYILMIVGGGQLGIALAYAISPLVVYSFLVLHNLHEPLQRCVGIITCSVFYAILMLFDLRIAYTIGMLVILITIGKLIIHKNTLYSVFPIFISFICSFFLLAFWLVPFIYFRNDGLQLLSENGSIIDSLKFFSVADFSHTLSLLHPNWPENIFGKVYFMQGEFLIIPILTYCGLLLHSKIKYKNLISPSNVQNNLYGKPIDYLNSIFFFSFVGLFGAFLAKGIHEPFGKVYEYLFRSMPGFNIFRDPTKWYLLIVLSYIVTIPFSLEVIEKKFLYQYVKSKSLIISIFFIIIWIFLQRQAYSYGLNQTFSPKVVPENYILISNYLQKDTKFSRILWVPEPDSFSYSSSIHPSVSSRILLHENTIQYIATNSSQFLDTLYSNGIGYIAIPIDVKKRIFLNDGKYEEKLRNDFIQIFNHITDITSIKIGNNSIGLYKLQSSLPLFFVQNQYDNMLVTYTKISSDEYSVLLPKTSLQSLTFLQSYSPYWQLRNGKSIVKPIKTNNGFQQYDVSDIKNSTVMFEYVPKIYFTYGLSISCIFILMLIGTYFLCYNKQKQLNF